MSDTIVVVDTNVFTARLRKDRPLEVQYTKHTLGRRVAVAPQTVAEARYGALKASWGPRRLAEFAQAVARVRILPVDLDLIEAVADLRNECARLVTRCTSAGTTRISGSLERPSIGTFRWLLMTRCSSAVRDSISAPSCQVSAAVPVRRSGL